MCRGGLTCRTSQCWKGKWIGDFETLSSEIGIWPEKTNTQPPPARPRFVQVATKRKSISNSYILLSAHKFLNQGTIVEQVHRTLVVVREGDGRIDAEVAIQI